jgi:hypothetical protein
METPGQPGPRERKGAMEDPPGRGTANSQDPERGKGGHGDFPVLGTASS